MVEYRGEKYFGRNATPGTTVAMATPTSKPFVQSTTKRAPVNNPVVARAEPRLLQPLVISATPPVTKPSAEPITLLPVRYAPVQNPDAHDPMMETPLAREEEEPAPQMIARNEPPAAKPFYVPVAKSVKSPFVNPSDI
jgi:hypothetical protein